MITLITIIGCLIGLFAFKMVTFSLPIDKRPEVLSPPSAILDAMVAKTTEACPMWTERYFEQKLVEAGIMKVIDMTTCDINGCLNCKPTRQSIQEAEDAEDMLAKRARWALEHKARTEAIAVKSAMVKANESRMKDKCPHQRLMLAKYGRYDKVCDNCADYAQVDASGNEYYVTEDGAGNVIRAYNPADINCVTCNKPGIHTHTFELAKELESPGEASNIVPLISHRLNGVTKYGTVIRRPDNVPDRASVEIVYSRGGERQSVEWAWPDGTGYSRLRFTMEESDIVWATKPLPDPRIPARRS